MKAEASEWFADRLPASWGALGVEIVGDQDELLVVIELGDAGSAAKAGVAGLRIFREATRDERMDLARAAEQKFDRKVSWGATAGGTTVVFTTTSVPVMTRLRLPERQVLDTLIGAGVARSRSEALAWCVKLVGEHEDDWISELRGALEAVVAARQRGPRGRRHPPEPRDEPHPAQ